MQGEDFQDGQKTVQSYFVSFSYSGSNLFDAYEITQTDVTYFFTAFNSWIRIEKDLHDGTFLFFSSEFNWFYDANGDWTTDYIGPWSTGIGSSATGDSFIADYGDAGTWQRVDTDNDVPEPATALLLGAALVGLGVARRNRFATHTNDNPQTNGPCAG